MIKKPDLSSTKSTNKAASVPPDRKPTSAKEDIDNLFTFQFRIFNPVRWFMHFLEKLEKDKTGQITIKIPFLWYLTFLVIMFGGGGVIGAFAFAPTQFLKGQLAERNIWVSKPTPTPVVIIPTPAPVLVTRLGIIKATYQVQNLIPTSTPTPSPRPDASASSALQGTVTLTPEPSISPSVVRFVLMTDTYKLIYLRTPPEISLQRYIGYKALVTGYYTSSTNTIALDKLADLEILY
jgi:hypothetical protein